MAADALAALLARGSAALKTGLDSRLADAGATVGIVVGVRTLALDARHIPTASMRPTFLEGDLLLVDKLSVKLRPPRRGEVVLFRAPPKVAKALKLKQTWGSDACFIKRVVATAGDEVRVSNGRLLVRRAAAGGRGGRGGDGGDAGGGSDRRMRPLAEPYVAERMRYQLRRTVVPDGHLFVLGDNRNDSYDSHAWGALPAELVIGRPMCTYWPPRRVRGAGAYAADAPTRGRPALPGWAARPAAALRSAVAQRPLKFAFG